MENLRFILEVYALNDDDAARLMKEVGVGPGLYGNVRDLVQAGSARFETLMVNTAAPGQRAQLEQVDEIRFPSQFHAPLADGELPFPIRFEGTFAGESLEYEAALSLDKTACNLDIAFSLDRLNGFSARSDYPQLPVVPGFDRQKLQTTRNLGIGSMDFIGDMAGSSNAGTRRWIFGRVDLQQVAKDAGGAASAVSPVVQVFSLDREDAKHILETQSPQCYAAVKELSDSGKARLEAESPEGVVQVDSGKSYDIDVSTGEMKIPSQYELTVDGTNTWAQKTARQSHYAGVGSAVGYPVDYVTHPLGLHFEIQPMSQQDGTVSIAAKPSFGQRFGTLRGGENVGEMPPQPVTVLQRADTSFRVAPGAFSLVGTLNPPGENGVNDRKDSGRVWLCFVRVDRAKGK